jgi:hypothetical protein
MSHSSYTSRSAYCGHLHGSIPLQDPQCRRCIDRVGATLETVETATIRVGGGGRIEKKEVLLVSVKIGWYIGSQHRASANVIRGTQHNAKVEITENARNASGACKVSARDGTKSVCFTATSPAWKRIRRRRESENECAHYRDLHCRKYTVDVNEY